MSVIRPLVVATVSQLVVAHATADSFVVPLMPVPPVLDGRVDADEWRVSAGFDGLHYNKQLERRRAFMRVGATESHLHVAIMTQLPDEGVLKADHTRDSLKAVHDDAVEVFVNPAPNVEKQVEYQFLVNSIGKGGYKVHTLGGAQVDASWTGGWQQAHGMHDGFWHFECSIPIASLANIAKGRKSTDGTWNINLTRDWKPDWGWSTLSGEGGNYTFKGYPFAFVRSGAPAVRYETDKDATIPGSTGTLTIHNPGKTALSLKASAVLDRNRMPALRQSADLALAPGEERTLQLAIPPDDPTTVYGLRLQVQSQDGKTTFYDRTTKWNRAEQPVHYSAAKTVERPPLDFRYAYYPYRNRMRVVADINGLPEDAKLGKLACEIRNRDTDEAVKRVELAVDGFADGRQEAAFDLPPLDGHFEIRLTAEGANVPAEPVIKRFERKRFPWENTPTGHSTEVYPPFTPIELKGKSLATVLRQHTLNDVGLSDQVRAESAHTGMGKEILAAPMRYVVSTGGADQAVQATALTTVSSAPHQVVTDSVFSAGALKMRSRNTWDYDGTVKVELALLPTDDATVDALFLDIPFRNDVAQLIHANSDRIRAPVAQRIPQGDGVLWDASKVACDEFLTNFCPYMFVGDAVRGICWFSENDLGWGWDRSTPNMVLTRENGVVTLRVRLINQPTVIREPRTITFGLLAAPVKPRYSPAGKHGWRYRYLRDNYTLLGTDINWLARGSCGSLYPAAKDLYLWEMIKKGNEQQLPREVVAGVVKHAWPYFEPYGEKTLDSFIRHVRHNLTSRYGKKMVFYYNRASNQLHEEFETFKDEWILTDLRSVPKGVGRGEIKIVPSDSYIDYALYWYARSFEIGGNRGVYWDNWFIAPSFNTTMTDAYRNEDGSITPAAGIWQLRELCKRTFVMMNERGIPPITFPHMTSFNPLPMMSFATVQYDWEWKYSLGDVQNRHSRELILLMSNGEHAGVWPVPLSDHGPKANDPWEQRTFTAVRLVHELDGFGGFGNTWQESHRQNAKLAEPILELLDEPDLEVYRYWDERTQPVSTGHADLPCIVYSLPGRRTVVAVVSYADGDREASLSVDTEKLGLGANFVIEDTETGERLALREGAVTIVLKKHDVRVLRMSK